ncbi:MAG: class I SAM-dependent methyltransferase [Clostridia bacterium]|nr:class I SAM-dependent methyltransferase [Clostridia bacterium]
MSGYRALGGYYDRLMGTDVDYAARAAYLLSLFARFGSRPTTLLDLACGSGKLTRELALLGLDMTGTDASPDMLMQAREAVAGLTPEVLLLQQDMRALDLNDTVDGAVCTQDSLNHLCKTADIAAVLARLRLFVSPQGLFIFDVNTPYKHRYLLGNNDFVLEEDGLLCLWRNRLEERTCTVRMDLDFLEEQPDGRYERVSDTVVERAYSLTTWKKLLADAGFELLSVFADGTTDTPAADSDRWVLVARNTRAAEEYYDKVNENE